MKIKHHHPLINELNAMLIDLSVPSNISFNWNWGSMLGLILMIQLVTGIFLASQFVAKMEFSFDFVILITKNINMGWFLRNTHMNGASMFFVFVYFHIGRGLFYSSSKNKIIWSTGLMIIFLLMGTAFLGYVLPWGQMSFWGATVITNLVSAIPYIGNFVVEWLWGGFSVNEPTLIRFFTLHFLMPMILIMLVIIHLMSLHMYGSSNPLGMNSNLDKIPFYYYFVSKDLLSIILFILMFSFITMGFPNLMGDPENYNVANSLSTPIHSQPEWYFLFAYAILRSIPNKLGGVISLFLSIFMIVLLSFKNKIYLSMKFNSYKKFYFYLYVSCFIILTWIGANPVEFPFEMIGQFYSVMYFIFLLSL